MEEEVREGRWKKGGKVCTFSYGLSTLTNEGVAITLEFITEHRLSDPRSACSAHSPSRRRTRRSFVKYIICIYHFFSLSHFVFLFRSV